MTTNNMQIKEYDMTDHIVGKIAIIIKMPIALVHFNGMKINMSNCPEFPLIFFYSKLQK